MERGKLKTKKRLYSSKPFFDLNEGQSSCGLLVIVLEYQERQKKHGERYQFETKLLV